MYDSFWDLHDVAGTSQRHEYEPRRESDEVLQDMFDSLNMEPNIDQNHHFFDYGKAAGFSRSLPRHAAVFFESADDNPDLTTRSHHLYQNDHAGTIPVPALEESMRTGESIPRSGGGCSFERETAQLSQRQTGPACQEPIDLTRLLDRCEGDVALLTEVPDPPLGLDRSFFSRSALSLLRLSMVVSSIVLSLAPRWYLLPFNSPPHA
jgi:hypothetical protein